MAAHFYLERIMFIKQALHLRPISPPEILTFLICEREYPTAYELVPFDYSSLPDQKETDHA
jgi:hypothetical protein